ncbi:helix-turn-helix domain-containing protein [Actinokineospora sp. NPDC004072]
MDLDDSSIGRRVREIRAWRKVSLTAVAGLAGMSPGYLSRIERGLRPVTKRATLEALASALRVDPAELVGKPYPPNDECSAVARAAIGPLLDALEWRPGEVPDVPPRPWAAVQADVDRQEQLRSAADLAGQAELVPGLVLDLLAAAAVPGRRRPALLALLRLYDNLGGLLLALGAPGGALLAVDRVGQVAEELDDPVWLAVAEWSRVQRHRGANRERQHRLAVRALDRAPATRPETVGMLHLNAALSAAVLGDTAGAATHLDEAEALAESMDVDVSPWPGGGMMLFGRTNAAIWRAAIGAEIGEHAWLHDRPAPRGLTAISVNRQSAFWVDYGRTLLTDRQRHRQGFAALLRAEGIAPQHFRNNPYAREAVAGLLSSPSPPAGAARELRGLGWRMGLAQRDEAAAG